MTTKKIQSLHKSASCAPLTQFRTVVKSRINKQTVTELANLSTSFQSAHLQNDAYSVRSSSSKLQKIRGENSDTNKLKSFVRNMNQSNLILKKNKSYKAKNDSLDLKESRNSVCSVKSTNSRSQHFRSLHKQMDSSDNKSGVSSRSLVSSSLVQKCKFVLPKQSLEPSKQRVIERVNKMEQKLENLVKSKLRGLMARARSKDRFNPKPFLGAPGLSFQSDSKQDSLLQKQIQGIVAAIAALKQMDSDQIIPLAQIEQEITQLDKKIGLLEKIIASNFTQSEILKKFYFAQKSQKYPHLNRKQKILQEIFKRKQLLKSNYSLVQSPNILAQTPIMKYESTSKYSYMKPSRGAYTKEPHRLRSFVANRQPMIRSSYGRQFLNYGTLPVFNYKPHDNKQSCSSLNTKTSNYQQAYKEKNMHTTQINYRDLDCFKNKIKTGNISFAQMYKSKELKKKKSSGVSMNRVKQMCGQSHEKQNKNSVQKAMQTLNCLQRINNQRDQNLSQSKQESASCYKPDVKFMGGTQMKRQYIWHSSLKTQEGQKQLGQSPIYRGKGVIKNGNLNSLKDSYKMAFLR